MCLLISHPADTQFDFSDIEDFYSYNKDGIGIMYSDSGVLRVVKLLPKDALEAHTFYLEHAAGRDCVIHFRMKTHGDIDLENCHPYKVYGDGSTMPVYMAHNGVLHTGNAADKSMSDTWHYIKDYIIPLTEDRPELLFDDTFVELLEAHIGSGNKFIFMNSEGQTSIVNRAAFVEHKGALLSNTYAWSAFLHGHGDKWSKAYSGSFRSGFLHGYGDKYDDYKYDDKYDDYSKTYPSTAPKPAEEEDEADPVGAFYTAVDDWSDMLFDVLDKAGFRNAYKQISFADAETFYNATGEDYSWNLVEMVEEGLLTESQVQDAFDRVLLGVALSEAELAGFVS